MDQATTTQAVDFAYYVYLLKDDDAGLAAMRDFFTRRYEVVSEQPDLLMEGPGGESLHSSHLRDADGHARIDLHVMRVANVVAVQTLWSRDKPRARARWADYVRQLEEVESGVLAAGSTWLGDAIVFVAGGLADIPLPSGQELTASVDGLRVHHPAVGLGAKRHHYVIERGDKRLHDFLTTDLPHIDWAIHRLRREVTYFADRHQTIVEEKNDIDDEINKVLHQRIVSSIPDASQRERLEEEIGKLSVMYGKLATDLHLIKEGRMAINRDLQQITVSDPAFDGGVDAAVGFPSFYIRQFQEHLTRLQTDEEDLRQSLDNAKAAIGIVQTQVELLRGGEGLELQEQTRELLNQNVRLEQERISLQVAAQVVELVIIFYYTLKSWESVAPLETVHGLHPGIKFVVVAMFAGAMVSLTHAIAKSIESKHPHWRPLVLSAAAALVSLGGMVIFPALLAH